MKKSPPPPDLPKPLLAAVDKLNKDQLIESLALIAEKLTKKNK